MTAAEAVPEPPDPDPEREAPPVAAVGPRAVDTHCHLFLMEEEASAAVTAARAAGVTKLICVGIDAQSSRRSRELAESFRGVFATAGVHPHSASDFDRNVSRQIEELLVDPMVVGVGETGLDHYRKLSPPKEQERVFRTHIAMSRETGKPLVVHVREAWPDALRVLEDAGAERVVLHCFSGDEEIAAEAARRGYHLSFAANVTYPNAEGIRRAATAVDVDRLLTETDSPFLPPQSIRGQPNSPSNVFAVIDTLAQARGEPVEQLTAQLAGNAADAFPLLR